MKHGMEKLTENSIPMEKPNCPLVGQNGNIFNLAGIASRTLKENGMEKQTEEMLRRILGSGSYVEALYIIGEYVHITSVENSGKNQQEELAVGYETNGMS